ncbi:hypothetical protein DFH09DRAFT_1111827 [Mycena vulgaris]|nr:hypothetical protein DFH09DRAFT_1111827 [Mycena vulgaris]
MALSTLRAFNQSQVVLRLLQERLARLPSRTAPELLLIRPSVPQLRRSIARGQRIACRIRLSEYQASRMCLANAILIVHAGSQPNRVVIWASLDRAHLTHTQFTPWYWSTAGFKTELVKMKSKH